MSDSSSPYHSDGDLPSLRPTGWAVLGMLSFGHDLSGYDLKMWANWSLRFFYWAPSFSQIYTELKKLEELGLATSRVASAAELRSKRVYAITDAGRDALTRWNNEVEPEPMVLKHSVMLRLWLGHTTGSDQLATSIIAHREWAEKMRVRAVADIEGSVDVPSWAYPELVLRWAESFYADERDRADVLLAGLADAEARVEQSRRDGIATPPADGFRRHRS